MEYWRQALGQWIEQNKVAFMLLSILAVLVIAALVRAARRL